MFTFGKEFTVRQGGRYRANITLSSIQALGASPDVIRSGLTDAGFSNVTVSGAGTHYTAEGSWAGPAQSAEIPNEVTSIVDITPPPTSATTSAGTSPSNDTESLGDSQYTQDMPADPSGPWTQGVKPTVHVDLGALGGSGGNGGSNGFTPVSSASIPPSAPTSPSLLKTAAIGAGAALTAIGLLHFFGKR